ncbi:MAG TPA: CPBP family intramembrane glutamic endopeptidase, partial [Steroidobacteraceae bacterium]|nr:CPBP family intramembrane glutamic endopeptidase [Steroidobacteraceae bacterium]
LPRNVLYAANLHFLNAVPWAVPVLAAYLWCYWRYLRGEGPPDSTRDLRRTRLRANRVSGRAWVWSLLAGGLGIVALVLALRLVNRLVVLPPQEVPDLSQVPALTLWTLVLLGAPVAGLVEEAAFRGYMQGPIERRFGLTLAILITGTMFAVSHLDFTLILWPYYVAVAALYGTVTWLCNSIWPTVVLHTLGNTWSNSNLLLYGQAEWQASADPSELVWTTGADETFVRQAVTLVVVAAATAWAYSRLAGATRRLRSP